LREEWAIRDLAAPDPTDKLGYVLDAVKSIRRALDGSVPLIGFSGSPFTLACYMVEGSGSDDFRTVKSMLYQRPDLLHHILEVNTKAVTDYLNAQIEAGAQAVMIFDTWGGMLSQRAYREFSLAYLARVVEGLKKENDGRRVPSVLFTKGGGLWLEDMAATGCDALGLDWTIDIGAARKRVGDKVALQGNFDPLCLMGSPEAIVSEAEAILESYGKGSGHVFNLGHGINQYTPPESVDLLLKTVREISPKYHVS
jgi:uroporphyrinogen decarboxylase